MPTGKVSQLAKWLHVFLCRVSIAHALLERIKVRAKIRQSRFIILDHCFLVKLAKIMYYDVA